MSAATSATAGTPRLAPAPLPRRVLIPGLIAVAIILGSNHVAARFAFEHGTGVTTMAALRSLACLALCALLIAASGGLPKFTRANLRWTLVVGCLFALQTYCIFSSIARIPVALSLLVFNTYPLILLAVAAFEGRERIRANAATLMLVVIAGLFFALDVGGLGAGRGFDPAARWQDIGVGVLWALAASAAVSGALWVNTRHLGGFDVRLRSLISVAVIALIMGAAIYGTGGGPQLPRDNAGWVAVIACMVLYGAGFTMMLALVPRARSVSDVSALNIEPIAALLAAWLLLGQSMTLLQCVGAAIVVAGIAALATIKR